MRQLRFVALAEDGSSIIVVDATGEQYRLPIDEQYRAAARGDAARLGQLAIHAESSLRPAEIQARVRSGASVEEVARAASVPLERVLPFARAVLLERAHIAEDARAVHCRPWESGEAHPLGELVDARLLERGLEPEQATWDAARRDNGTWRVTVQFGEGKRAGEAAWIYEPAARQVRANDATAHELIAEPRVEPEWAEPEPAVEASDEDSSTSPVEDSPTTREPSLAVVREVRPRTEPPAEQRADEPEETAGAGGRAKRGKRAAAGAGAGRRQGAVPSWEDIMFGVRGRENG